MEQKQYYWWWEKFITKENIKKINKCKLTSEKDRPANVKKTSKVVFFPYKKIKKYLNNALENCYVSNNNNFQFDLFNFDENQNINHNTYSSKNKSQYDWHIDFNFTNTHDIKFTVLINVSEKKYEGGQFKIMTASEPWHVKELDKPGNMIMFRSHILHKVEPVTKGERKTLAFFLLGPNFR